MKNWKNGLSKTSFDLSNASDCREWLTALRIGPNKSKITFLKQHDGKEISIADATDEQVINLCQEMAFVLSGKGNKA